MMRIIVLFVVAVCASATSVEAQEAHSVVVTSDGLPAGANGSHWGCCPNDIDYCLNLWSTYCQERRSRGTSHRRLAAAHCGHCSHGGIFTNGLHALGTCGLRCQNRVPGCESCDKSECIGSGLDAVDEVSPMADEIDAPLDDAGDIDDQPPLAPPTSLDDAPGLVPPEPAPDASTDSAGRWYLPFIWKK